jgi:Sugar (pentulose and hexulose) kinases
MITIGIDIGSSSIKVSLLDIEKGECISSCSSPNTEMKIISNKTGWAEQDPEIWWEHVCICLKKLVPNKEIASQVKAIGIAYQMHGLVCVDKNLNSIMNSIIWCDSRAVGIGNEAFDAIGKDKCLKKLLNSPGNFTISKLAWVKRNLPDTYSKIYKFLLPGDYIMLKLTGKCESSECGISEEMLWDFSENKPADFLLDYFGIDKSLVPEFNPGIGIHGYTNKQIESLLGIKEGTPISYKCGDQPNNAFSLNVLEPGEIAATGGTSGVVYGVTDTDSMDTLSRVNTVMHVNNTREKRRNGILLCINGTGILNAWIKRNLANELSYSQMNECMNDIPAGSEGLIVLPFGNGAERMLCNKFTGTQIMCIDLNKHNKKHILRAQQEGIAFAFKYGIDIMRSIGSKPQTIKAGYANLFLSPIFTQTLATIANVAIELYNTDGAQGAARGAALGAGLYKNVDEAFANLKKIEVIQPCNAIKENLNNAYVSWKNALENALEKI